MRRSLLASVATLVLFASHVTSSLDCQHSFVTTRGWTRGRRVLPEERIEFLLALKHQRGTTESLEGQLVDGSLEQVSTAQLFDLGFTASSNTLATIAAWLPSGAVVMTRNHDFARVSVSRTVAESLLPGAEFFYYVHATSRKVITRSATSLALPFNVSDAVDATEGLCDFPKLKQRGVLSKAAVSRGVDLHRVTAGDRVLNLTACVNTTGLGVNVTHVQVNATQSDTLRPWHAEHTWRLPVSEAGCFPLNGQLTGAANYRAVRLSARTTLSDGAHSPWVDYESAIIPSPFATPKLVRELYAVPPDALGGQASNNSMAVVEFDQQYYSPQDLDIFLAQHGVPRGETPVRVVGPNNATSCYVDGGEGCGESTLDIQWILAVAPKVLTLTLALTLIGSSPCPPSGGAARSRTPDLNPNLDPGFQSNPNPKVPVVFWSQPKGFLLSWLADLANTSHIPYVFSVSYGEPEAPLGQIWTPNL